MSYELLEKLGGIQWPCNEKYPEGKKRLYDETFPFPTEDGKAKLLPVEWVPLSESCNPDFPLTLNTGRTVEQWHTRTKTKSIKILNDLAPESWCEINPKDAEKLQVESGDRIKIGSARGEVVELLVKVTETVREGNCFVPFHFGEKLINRLTIDEFDPYSFEPNFKQCAVQIRSEKVPTGIRMKEQEISGELAYETTTVTQEVKISQKSEKNV